MKPEVTIYQSPNPADYIWNDIDKKWVLKESSSDNGLLLGETIVALQHFNGYLFCATNLRVFKMVNDTFVPMKFVEIPPEPEKKDERSEQSE